MTNSGQSHGLPSGPAQKVPPKPTLGPPHDTFATLTLALAYAAALFFAGQFQGEGDTLKWIGMIASLAVAIAAVFYFQRAYGFAFRGRGKVTWGATVAGVFSYMYVQQFVPSALYEMYFHESVFIYSVSCLAVAALPVAVLRGSLGKASSPKQAGETVPHGIAADAQTRGSPEERE